ncbi:MAG: 5'-deoxynucleotidase YfbR-like HD superfamily hydrolase [Candidatus Paceibacteria bacterium]|jgi:5'-deoxynucleotidase YfbR-like HD superfamily hydrolase
MHILCDYFLPLEDLKGKWDLSKIQGMIQYHDIGEILTGDIIGFRKSSQNRIDEDDAVKKSLKNFQKDFWVESKVY